MYKLCKTEQSARRQKEIEAGLLNMINDIGYESITVTNLCRRMEMPRKAFYRYFDSKESVLDALIEHTLSEYRGFHTGVPPERRSLIAELEGYFKYWYERRALLDTFSKNNILSRLIDASLNYPVGDMINVAKFLPEDDTATRRQIFRFAICGLTVMMLDWYKRGFQESFSGMAKYACRMLSRPLFPDLASLGFV